LFYIGCSSAHDTDTTVFVGTYFAKNGKYKKNSTKPLVLAVHNSQKNSHLVVGLHPNRIKQKIMGKYLRQAATQTNSRILVQHFENSILEIHAADINRWIDYLPSLM